MPRTIAFPRFIAALFIAVGGVLIGSSAVYADQSEAQVGTATALAQASISAGDINTCMLTNLGEVYCWGDNYNGQFGNGTSGNDSAIPVKATGIVGAKAVMSAGSSTCAVTSSNALKCWGANFTGSVGDGTGVDAHLPADPVGLTSGVAAVSGSSYTNCALTTAGGVQCWGDGTQRQIGDGTTNDSNSPVQVSGLTSGVVAITGGGYANCALLGTGRVKCWGQGTFGALGNGAFSNSGTPVEVSGITNAVAISGSDQAFCALLTTGAVTCWGNNSSGVLGDGTTNNSNVPLTIQGMTAKAISVGQYHACILTTSGGIKCWGQNAYGQLGNGSTTQALIPVDVTGLTAGVSAVTVGTVHTCALTLSGAMKCWGQNSYKQLGDGTTNNSNIPVTVAGFATGVGPTTTTSTTSTTIASTTTSVVPSSTIASVVSVSANEPRTMPATGRRPSDMALFGAALIVFGFSVMRRARTV